jgi:hypothetical protein
MTDMGRIAGNEQKVKKAAEARLGARLRAAFFALAAFIVSFQGLGLTSLLARGIQDEGAVAVTTPVGVDCAQQNSDLPRGDRRTHDCPLTGFCCVAGCDGQASIGLAETPFVAVPWTGLENGPVGRIAWAQGRISCAGWASSWSSRAPPFFS